MKSVKAEMLPVYQEEDVVLAKVENDIPWPAVIVHFRGYKLNQDFGEDQEYYRVQFFGDHTWANLYNYQITPLTFPRITQLRGRMLSNRKFLTSLGSAENQIKKIQKSLGGQLLQNFERIYRKEDPILQQFFKSGKELIEKIRILRKDTFANYGRKIVSPEMQKQLKRQRRFKRCTFQAYLQCTITVQTKNNQLTTFTNINSMLSYYCEDLAHTDKNDDLNSTTSQLHAEDNVPMEIELESHLQKEEKGMNKEVAEKPLGIKPDQFLKGKRGELKKDSDRLNETVMNQATQKEHQLALNKPTKIKESKGKFQSHKPQEVARIKLKAITQYIQYNLSSKVSPQAKAFIQAFDFGLAQEQVRVALQLLVSSDHLVSNNKNKNKLKMLHEDVNEFFTLFQQREIAAISRKPQLQAYLTEKIPILPLARLLLETFSKAITSLESGPTEKSHNAKENTFMEKNLLEMVLKPMKLNYQKFSISLRALEKALNQ